MQAKLFWAVTSMTPSMVLVDRANSSAPNMGLRAWPKADIRQQDVLIAKNYLTQAELKELNRLTDILLSIFEDQLDLGKLTKMAQATALLEQNLRSLNRQVLRHGGTVKHATAERVVKQHYVKFDKQRREARRLAAEQELAALKAAAEVLPKPRKRRRKD